MDKLGVFHANQTSGPLAKCRFKPLTILNASKNATFTV